MSRLNFVLAFDQPTVADNDGVITLTILANSSGTLQGRIFKQGEAAPAFSNISNPQVWNALESADWRIEFKDNNGERLIARIQLEVPASTCGEDAGEIAVLADRVRIQLTNPPTGFYGSLNQGANWKKIIGIPPKAEWTNSELQALGLNGPTIPYSRLRTETDPGLPPSDSALFGRGSSPSNACANTATPTTYYWAPGTWGPGTVMYTDAALTTRLTGFTHIVNVNGPIAGDIYNLNSANGVVGSYTGVSC